MSTKLNGYGAYKLYIALKTHFNSDTYDIVKFKGITPAKYKTYANRHDRAFFDYVCTKYNRRDLFDLFMANFVTTDLHISELLDMDASKVYKSWHARRDSRTYIFEKELISLLENIGSIKHIADIDNDATHPVVVDMVLQYEISLETFIILDAVMGIFARFDTTIVDDFIWKKLVFRCRKYKVLLNINTSEYNDIVKRVIDKI